MKLYEFRLRDGSRMYGTISYIDEATETAYVLPKDQVGMLGHNGLPIRFADCEGIYCETVRPGLFDSEEQIVMYRRRWRTG